MTTPLDRVVRAGLVAFVAWSLWLPLSDVLSYPDRLSVLPNLQTDAAAYHAIASDFARTRSLDALPPRHPPGWVVLLGLTYVLAGPSFVAGKLILWLAFVLSVVACAWLAQRIYGRPDRASAERWRPEALGSGGIAAALCASAPALRGYVGTLQYEIVTAAALLVVFVLGLRTIDARIASARLQRAAITGAAAGILILTRETFAVVVPLVAVWMGDRIQRTVSRRAAVIVIVTVMGVAATPAVIWSGVQSVRHKTLITISEKGPIVVELGNNPLANGTYNAPLVGIGQPTGLAFVRQFPGQAIVLATRKIFYFWGVLRDGWNVPRPTAVWLWRATTGLIPLEFCAAIARGGWLLALFLVSLWMMGRRGLREWWALPAAVVMMMAVHVATLSSHRFAVPILPIVFAMISGPLAAVLQRAAVVLRTPMLTTALAGLGLIVLLMQFQTWPLEVSRAAADLDGQAADNVVDPVSRARVRMADARRGERPVVLLTDEYLPRGPLRIDTGLRLAGAITKPGPVARIALVELDGHVACARDMTADVLTTDGFTTVAVPCRLSKDTPATLAIFTLGAADLAIDTVRLIWTSQPARPE